MTKRRTKGLSGLPSEHAARMPKHAAKIETQTTKTQAAIANRRCSDALDRLMEAEFARGALSVDAHDSEKGYTVRDMQEDFDLGFRDAEREFRKHCLRKPGLLDRFRRKKD
jgi:hypothetical protein